MSGAEPSTSAINALEQRPRDRRDVANGYRSCALALVTHRFSQRTLQEVLLQDWLIIFFPSPARNLPHRLV